MHSKEILDLSSIFFIKECAKQFVRKFFLLVYNFAYYGSIQFNVSKLKENLSEFVLDNAYIFSKVN